MTNWDLCFICQRSTNEGLRSSIDGLNTLATNILKFNEFGRLKIDYSRIANKNENLLSILKPMTPNITTYVNRATVKANLKDSNYELKNN